MSLRTYSLHQTIPWNPTQFFLIASIIAIYGTGHRFQPTSECEG